MTRTDTKMTFALAARRAKILQTLHDYVISYGIENKMTCDELTTLITGLLIRTTNGPAELGAAVGNVAGKCVEFSAHALSQVKTEGNA